MNERVVIVGGGLAGLAAAAALAPRGLAVTLLESRPRWGGRASSFVDHTTGEPIDNCQHVALGCCTNFLHFCRNVGIESAFRCEERLTFVGPEGDCSDLAATPLPAPLHLFPAFARLRFLTWPEKWRMALGLRALARVDPAACGDETFLHWLQRHRQPPAVIERFWHVVLVSALSETLDRIDVGHARKVFVDSFLRNRHGWEVWLPTVPLDDLYETIVERGLTPQGATCRLQVGVRKIEDGGSKVDDRRVGRVELRSGEKLEADQVILAVPQLVVRDMLPDAWRELPLFANLDRLETAPISSVHLWFDRPITDLRHATFVDRLSQWLFNRSAIQSSRVGSAHREPTSTENSHYYQIVISASRELAERSQAETIQTVVDELAAVWPVVREAKLIHSRLVTEHKAVVSMLPGVDCWRPSQQTPIENLHLAGDWTQTGWPGTMEGAVRSGYLAAESVLRRLGRPASLVQPDLPTALLSRILMGLQ
jgi:squalene-associated FAD-dependent desaturase